jgi:hypothetical protein
MYLDNTSGVAQFIGPGAGPGAEDLGGVFFL